MITRDQFAVQALGRIGKATSKNNVTSLVVWMDYENTQAYYNPFATERKLPGSTDFNAAGVQNYTTLDQGLEAFKETIENGYYGSILDCLTASATPYQTCKAVYDSAWGSKPTPDLVNLVVNDWPNISKVAIGEPDVAPAPTPVAPAPVPVPAPPTPSSEECNVNLPILNEGSTGNCVKAAQAMINQVLINLNSSTPPLKVDGIYGPITAGYVRNLEIISHDSDPSIVVDSGIVGPQVWGLLLGTLIL